MGNGNCGESFKNLKHDDLKRVYGGNVQTRGFKEISAATLNVSAYLSASGTWGLSVTAAVTATYGPYTYVNKCL